MRISIIVCTYNRCEILKYCLDSLEKQYVEKAQYEVIVVDNNSTDNTKEVVEEYCGRNSNFRYVFEENQGLSHARNRGAKESEADWVGYVDDDGKVRENYIEQALYTIENFDFDCFGGKVVNWFKYGKPRWYSEIYDPEKEKYKEICEYEGFVSGGISFYKKAIIIMHGGFSSELGMKGGEMGVGEETRLQVLIKKNGGKTGLNPFITLEHIVAPEKMNILYFIKRSYHAGKVENTVFNMENDTKPSIFYMMTEIIKISVLNLRKFKNSDYFFENYLLDIFSHAGYLLGKYVSERS